MTNAQKAAALHLSCALACLDAVQSLEPKKSARWNRLDGAIDAVNRCVDLYRLEAFKGEDIANAEKVFDAASELIRAMYP